MSGSGARRAYWDAVTPPVCPAQAVAAGMTKLVFDSDFHISKIDVNDTGAEGFDWYLRTAWPATEFYPSVQRFIDVYDNAYAYWHNFAPNDSSQFDVQGSVLRLKKRGPSHTTILSSCIAASNAAGFIGRAIGPGFYIEFDYRYPSIADASSLGFAVWGFPMNYLLGTGPIYNEQDWMEAYDPANTPHFAMVQWDFNNGTWTIPPDGPPATGTAGGQQFTPTVSHNVERYGALWQPAFRDPDHVGRFSMYYNNTQVLYFGTQPYVIYYDDGGPPAGFNKTCMASDQQPYNIMLAAPTNLTDPATCPMLRVWSYPP